MEMDSSLIHTALQQIVRMTSTSRIIPTTLSRSLTARETGLWNGVPGPATVSSTARQAWLSTVWAMSMSATRAVRLEQVATGLRSLLPLHRLYSKGEADVLLCACDNQAQL